MATQNEIGTTARIRLISIHRAIAAFVLLLVAFAAPAHGQEKKELAQELNESFKDLPAENPRWGLISLKAKGFIRHEMEGLRITLPGVAETNQNVGLGTKLAVKGDFEVTLGYEILREPGPEIDRMSTVFALEIYLAGLQREFASFTRQTSTGVGPRFRVLTRVSDAEQRQRLHGAKTVAAKEKTGRLRMVRTGVELAFLVAEGDAKDFVQLAKLPFGGADLIDIRFAASNTGMKADFDMRVTEMKVRGDAITSQPAAAIPFDFVPPKKELPPFVPGPVSNLTFTKLIEQDFRGGKPLTAEWTLVGKDRDQTVKAEEGLRITASQERGSRISPAGVRLSFLLEGDFEITAGYEGLAIDPLPGGQPVGVALNLVVKPDYQKFAKLGRFLHANAGHAYLAESFLKNEPLEMPLRMAATEAKSGQLRVIRSGAKLHFLVADEPPNPFRVIHQADFTAEPLEIVRLGVNNNGSPAGIDVRLIDLKIRYGAIPAASSDVRPGDIKPPPIEPPVPTPAATPANVPGWMMALVIGAGMTVLIVIGVAGWLVLSRRQTAGETAETAEALAEEPAPMTIVACPECGKKLKVKPALAGKKVKCTKCGHAVPVPN